MTACVAGLFLLGDINVLNLLYPFVMPMYNINEEEFNHNLLLTQLYCERQMQNDNMPVAEVLRSFNPEYNGKRLCVFDSVRRSGFSKPSVSVDWNIDPLEAQNEFSYSDLFKKQMAYKKGIIQVANVPINHKGKILVAEIDNVICDGVSEYESDGFIDYNDCPPIDTWFYMSKNKYGRVLYAWIPEQYVDLVEEAISVNMLSIIIWQEKFIADNRHL